ncbi:hypothetical protein HN011_005413 [Eciton burchellii]|nr:hypothetical protein HN011_005413 [Eciton burchellii]
MITRVHLLLDLLILCCVSKSALCEPITWLMQGDVLSEDEATSRLIKSHKSYFSVSTRAEVYFAAEPGMVINCVIAAAVYQNGHTVKREMVSVDGEFINSTKLGIVYEPIRNWTQQEIEGVLRNVTGNFLL